MLLVQAKLQVGVNMTMTFHLHVEDEQVIRKVRFRDLVEMPKRENIYQSSLDESGEPAEDQTG